MTTYEIPNRDDTVGKLVKLKLHPWAPRGPKKGIFNGQGPAGLSITIPGGGRYTYRHSEIKSIRLA